MISRICPDNEGRFYWLLDKIVRREGIGDVLANGTYWAARQIGNGAEEYAHNNIKKHEQLPLKLSMLNPIYFLMYATGEKMNITQIEGQFPQAPFPKKEHREKFRKGLVPGSRRKIQAVFPGLGTARRKLNPLLSDAGNVLRHCRLAGADALHR
jgi:aldehyde:ferredoxin oxidoreductase